MADSYETYLQWYTSDKVDEATKEELFSISRDKQEIEERFYRDLEFGTAGLRGVLGAGTNRMNRYVVERATQGLADYVRACGGAERGVCVAFDSRKFSDVFAREVACVLAANGIPAFLFDALRPVPLLSGTVPLLGCAAGVVITASHNPAKYNGYKVYWEDGGQAAPERAAAIFERIQNTPMFAARTVDFDAAVGAGLIRVIGAAEDEAYYRAAEQLLTYPELVKRHGDTLPVVYTPLNGSGNVPVRALLARVGLTNVSVVPEQERPDPAFPTVAAPNPEDPDAFTLARALAEQTGAQVILATDPDADRLGVSVRGADGSWRVLTGNQIGALLLEHILSSKHRAGTLPQNGAVVKSLVSTHLADAVAARYGVGMIDVLTGFRFISEKIDQFSRTGEKTFLFGFEESYGFLAGGLSRDKDAVSSAMLVCEMCVLAARENKTLSDRLAELYETYGHHGERVTSHTLEGKEGLEKIRSCMAALREKPPQSVGGARVTAFEDYLSGVVTLADGTQRETGLPPSDMLRFLLDGGAWIVVRPSGTEPKLKLYAGAAARSAAELDARLAALIGAFDAHVEELLK